jgi:hypothetical protein
MSYDPASPSLRVPYWEVVVEVDGKSVAHSFPYESDARYYLADCQAQGYTAEVVAR